MVVVVLIFKLPPTRARPRSQSTYFAWAPEGMETNWIPTAAGNNGPPKPLFAKTWKLSDIEKMS
jgi:hypothetical protein